MAIKINKMTLILNLSIQFNQKNKDNTNNQNNFTNRSKGNQIITSQNQTLKNSKITRLIVHPSLVTQKNPQPSISLS